MAGFLDTLQSMFGASGPSPTMQDPFADRNALEKFGIGLGGLDAYKAVGEQGLKSAKAAAMQDIAARMQNGDLDQKSALIEYAKRTGDYDKMFQTDTTPAAIREYEYVNKLGPEDRALYFQNKRANQMFDRGGSQVFVSPEGNTVREIDKTLAPEQTPEVKKQQAVATAQGEAEVGRDTDLKKKSIAADSTLSTIDEAEKLLGGTEVDGKVTPSAATGSYPGAAKTFIDSRILGNSTDASQANAALKVVSGKLVSAMPRMEGPQSDKDVALYKEMAANIGDSTVPVGDKQVALKTLRDLQAKYATPGGDSYAKPGMLPPPDMLLPPVDKKSAAKGQVIKFGDM